MFKVNFYSLLLFLVVAVGLTIALTPTFFGFFPFTFDQGRDLLWVKNQIDFKRPSLIGPWGSLAGVYFGPLWFWLLTIPYLISGGNPLVITLFNGLVVFGTIVLAAFLVKGFSRRFAYFLIFLGFLSSGVHGISGFAFSQHLLPLFTFLLLYSYGQLLLRTNRKHFLLSCFWLGLMFHAEPPLAVFSLPSLLVITYLSPKKSAIFNLKYLILGLIVFMIPFLPLIFFDLRHGFIQTKSVFLYLTGDNQSLGDILPFHQRLADRFLQFFKIFRLSVLQKPTLAAILLLIAVFVANTLLKKPKFLQKLWSASLIYVFSLLIIFIVYPPQLKSFYLDGFILISILWLALALTALWEMKKYRFFIVCYLVFAFVQNMSPAYFANSLKNNFADKAKAGSIFANQKRVLDWIYQDAAGNGFKVYTYVSPVYDYPYQYLFFWHGLRKYGYLPEEFAYLPGQPEYVQKKGEQLMRLATKIKKADHNIYLIVEKEGYSERVEKWYQNFETKTYSLLAKKEFPGSIVVEKRRIL